MRSDLTRPRALRTSVGLATIICSAIWLLDSCERRTASLVYDANSQTMKVPRGDGRPVMTDGMFQPAEWDDAATLVVNDSVSLLFKQYHGHVFMALDSRKLVSPSVDIFLCADSIHILQLHVSAQLGERWLQSDPDTDGDSAWIWGRTSHWYANEFRWMYRLLDSLVNEAGWDYEAAIKKAGFPHEAIEIELLRTKIGGSSWLWRFEVWTARTIDKPLSFPPDTQRESLRGWASLMLE